MLFVLFSFYCDRQIMMEFYLVLQSNMGRHPAEFSFVSNGGVMLLCSLFTSKQQCLCENIFEMQRKWLEIGIKMNSDFIRNIVHLLQTHWNIQMNGDMLVNSLSYNVT